MENPSQEQLTPVQRVYSSLQKLVGLHRQLLDTCRIEREALAQADLKQIEESTLAKQTVVDAIRQAEESRILHVTELARLWKKPIRELSLPNLILAIQAQDPKASEQYRSSFNTLTILIQRIIEQNDDNKRLVARSLANLNEMKRNVLGEAVPKSNTYTSQGQRAGVTGGARLLSKEA